jgi:hypothetical protein
MFAFNIFFNRASAESLCNQCVFAHMVGSDAGNRLTFCTYGYPTRPINFDVTTCTNFTVRNVRPITVVRGFTNAPAEVRDEEKRVASTQVNFK